MKNLRSQLLKTCIIALVCSGLTIGFAKPATGTQHTQDFTNWLQSRTNKVNTPELQRKLQSLKKSNGNLNQLIEKASQIVSENNDDFNIPLSSASDNLQQVLLVEWNQYQNGNAMAAIPTSETVKSSLALQQQKNMVGNTSPSMVNRAKFTFRLILDRWNTNPFCKPYNITPLVSGTAIGAP